MAGQKLMATDLREQLRAAIKQIGWSETARRSGCDRVTLHRAFGPRGNPKLSTIVAVLPVVGLNISLAPIAGEPPIQGDPSCSA